MFNFSPFSFEIEKELLTEFKFNKEICAIVKEICGMD